MIDAADLRRKIEALPDGATVLMHKEQALAMVQDLERGARARAALVNLGSLARSAAA